MAKQEAPLMKGSAQLRKLDACASEQLCTVFSCREQFYNIMTTYQQTIESYFYLKRSIYNLRMEDLWN